MVRGPLGYVAADVEGMEPAALAAALAEIGYEAVDWTMEQYDPLAEPPAALGRLVEAARASGLEVPQLMVHQDYVTDDPAAWEERVRRSELAVQAAAQAGVPTVGVVTGPNRWVDGHAVVGRDIDEERAWSSVLAALERVVAAAAAATGVRVCLEPCWGTLARDRGGAERALARFGPDELAVTVDPSHFVMSGDDVTALVDAWRARVAHVHLKDAFGREGVDGVDFCFLMPGEGSVDWRGLRDALGRVGYAGATCVEFESLRMREQALAGDVLAGAELAHRLARGVLGG